MSNIFPGVENYTASSGANIKIPKCTLLQTSCIGLPDIKRGLLIILSKTIFHLRQTEHSRRWQVCRFIQTETATQKKKPHKRLETNAHFPQVSVNKETYGRCAKATASCPLSTSGTAPGFGLNGYSFHSSELNGVNGGGAWWVAG